jgi:hypothetical protein
MMMILFMKTLLLLVLLQVLNESEVKVCSASLMLLLLPPLPVLGSSQLGALGSRGGDSKLIIDQLSVGSRSCL